MESSPVLMVKGSIRIEAVRHSPEQGLSRKLSVRLAIAARESAEVREAPPPGRRGDRGTVRGIGSEELPPSSIEADAAQIRERGSTEVALERVLQPAGAESRRSGDVGDRQGSPACSSMYAIARRRLAVSTPARSCVAASALRLCGNTLSIAPMSVCSTSCRIRSFSNSSSSSAT